MTHHTVDSLSMASWMTPTGLNKGTTARCPTFIIYSTDLSVSGHQASAVTWSPTAPCTCDAVNRRAYCRTTIKFANHYVTLLSFAGAKCVDLETTGLLNTTGLKSSILDVIVVFN